MFEASRTTRSLNITRSFALPSRFLYACIVGVPLWSYREDISEAIICPPQRGQGQPAPPRRAFCSQRRFPSEHGNNQPIRDWEQSLLHAVPEHKRIAQRRRRPCKKQELPPARICSGLAASVRLTAYSEIPVMSTSFGKCCDREAGLSTADSMAMRLLACCVLPQQTCLVGGQLMS